MNLNYSKKLKLINKIYFLRNLSLNFSSCKHTPLIFSFLRKKCNKKTKYSNLNILKILVFYLIYKNFLIKIKQFFLNNLISFYYYSIQNLNFKDISFRNTKIAKKSFWVLKKACLYVKISFLHIFIGVDILKNVFYKMNTNVHFIWFYIFYSFLKIYLKYKNNICLFRHIWYLTSVYFSYLEKFIKKLCTCFALTNFSKWKTNTKTPFNISMNFFHCYNNYNLYYVRYSNNIFFYLFCKVKHILGFYKEVKSFLEYILKIYLSYTDFSIVFIKQNLQKKTFSWCTVERFFYLKTKLKLRIFLLFSLNFLNLQKKNCQKSRQTFFKILTVIIIQTLLQHLFSKIKQKKFWRYILWLSNSFFNINFS